MSESSPEHPGRRRLPPRRCRQEVKWKVSSIPLDQFIFDTEIDDLLMPIDIKVEEPEVTCTSPSGVYFASNWNAEERISPAQFLNTLPANSHTIDVDQGDDISNDDYPILDPLDIRAEKINLAAHPSGPIPNTSFPTIPGTPVKVYTNKRRSAGKMVGTPSRRGGDVQDDEGDWTGDFQSLGMPAEQAPQANWVPSIIFDDDLELIEEDFPDYLSIVEVKDEAAEEGCPTGDIAGEQPSGAIESDEEPLSKMVLRSKKKRKDEFENIPPSSDVTDKGNRRENVKVPVTPTKSPEETKDASDNVIRIKLTSPSFLKGGESIDTSRMERRNFLEKEKSGAVDPLETPPSSSSVRSKSDFASTRKISKKSRTKPSKDCVRLVLTSSVVSQRKTATKENAMVIGAPPELQSAIIDEAILETKEDISIYKQTGGNVTGANAQNDNEFCIINEDKDERIPVILIQDSEVSVDTPSNETPGTLTRVTKNDVTKPDENSDDDYRLDDGDNSVSSDSSDKDICDKHIEESPSIVEGDRPRGTSQFSSTTILSSILKGLLPGRKEDGKRSEPETGANKASERSPLKPSTVGEECASSGRTLSKDFADRTEMNVGGGGADKDDIASSVGTEEIPEIDLSDLLFFVRKVFNLRQEGFRYSVKEICPLCQEGFENLSKHLLRVHFDDEDVRQFSKEHKGSNVRQHILKKWYLKVNYTANDLIGRYKYCSICLRKVKSTEILSHHLHCSEAVVGNFKLTEKTDAFEDLNRLIAETREDAAPETRLNLAKSLLASLFILNGGLATVDRLLINDYNKKQPFRNDNPDSILIEMMEEIVKVDMRRTDDLQIVIQTNVVGLPLFLTSKQEEGIDLLLNTGKNYTGHFVFKDPFYDSWGHMSAFGTIKDYVAIPSIRREVQKRLEIEEGTTPEPKRLKIENAEKEINMQELSTWKNPVVVLNRDWDEILATMGNSDFKTVKLSNLNLDHAKNEGEANPNVIEPSKVERKDHVEDVDVSDDKMATNSDGDDDDDDDDDPVRKKVARKSRGTFKSLYFKMESKNSRIIANIKDIRFCNGCEKHYHKSHYSKHKKLCKMCPGNREKVVRGISDVQPKQSDTLPKSTLTERKRFVCIFCSKTIADFYRHLKLMHRKEPAVEEMLSYRGRSKKKSQLYSKLEARATVLYNRSHRQKVKEELGKVYVPCPHCGDHFAKEAVQEHATCCFKKSSDSIQSKSANVMTKQIIPSFWKGAMKDAIRKDKLLMLFGSYMTGKRQTFRLQYIKRRLRGMARFLLAIKNRHPSITELSAIYKPQHCDMVAKMMMEVSRYDVETDTKKLYDKMRELRRNIKICGDVWAMECCRTKRIEDQRMATDFLCRLEEIYREWILAKLKRPSAPKQVDVPKDMFELSHDVMIKAAEELREEFSSNSWLDLANSLLIHVRLLNRNIFDSCASLRVSDYRGRHDLDPGNRDYPRDYVRVKLFESFASFVLSPELCGAVDVLVENRKEAGVPADNVYLFGRPQRKDHYTINDAKNYLRIKENERKFSANASKTPVQSDVFIDLESRRRNFEEHTARMLKLDKALRSKFTHRIRIQLVKCTSACIQFLNDKTRAEVVQYLLIIDYDDREKLCQKDLSTFSSIADATGNFYKVNLKGTDINLLLTADICQTLNLLIVTRYTTYIHQENLFLFACSGSKYHYYNIRGEIERFPIEDGDGDILSCRSKMILAKFPKHKIDEETFEAMVYRSNLENAYGYHTTRMLKLEAELRQKITGSTWTDLAKCVSTCIQLLNDKTFVEIVQYLLRDDYAKREKLEANADLSAFTTIVDLTGVFFKVKMQGSPIVLLLTADICHALDILMESRYLVRVHRHNPFVFGCPGAVMDYYTIDGLIELFPTCSRLKELMKARSSIIAKLIKEERPQVSENLLDNTRTVFSHSQSKLAELRRKLAAEFSYEGWLDLLKYLVTYLHLLNNLSPIYPETLRIGDFKNRKKLGSDENENVYHSLVVLSDFPADYYKTQIDSTGPFILMSSTFCTAADTLLSYRGYAGVRGDNPFLFGCRGKSDNYFRSRGAVAQVAAKCGVQRLIYDKARNVHNTIVQEEPSQLRVDQDFSKSGVQNILKSTKIEQAVTAEKSAATAGNNSRIRPKTEPLPTKKIFFKFPAFTKKIRVSDVNVVRKETEEKPKENVTTDDRTCNVSTPSTGHIRIVKTNSIAGRILATSSKTVVGGNLAPVRIPVDGGTAPTSVVDANRISIRTVGPALSRSPISTRSSAINRISVTSTSSITNRVLVTSTNSVSNRVSVTSSSTAFRPISVTSNSSGSNSISSPSKSLVSCSTSATNWIPITRCILTSNSVATAGNSTTPTRNSTANCIVPVPPLIPIITNNLVPNSNLTSKINADSSSKPSSSSISAANTTSGPNRIPAINSCSIVSKSFVPTLIPIVTSNPGPNTSPVSNKNSIITGISTSSPNSIGNSNLTTTSSSAPICSLKTSCIPVLSLNFVAVTISIANNTPTLTRTSASTFTPVTVDTPTSNSSTSTTPKSVAENIGSDSLIPESSFSAVDTLTTTAANTSSRNGSPAPNSGSTLTTSVMADCILATTHDLVDNCDSTAGRSRSSTPTLPTVTTNSSAANISGSDGHSDTNDVSTASPNFAIDNIPAASNKLNPVASCAPVTSSNFVASCTLTTSSNSVASSIPTISSNSVVSYIPTTGSIANSNRPVSDSSTFNSQSATSNVSAPIATLAITKTSAPNSIPTSDDGPTARISSDPIVKNLSTSNTVSTANGGSGGAKQSSASTVILLITERHAPTSIADPCSGATPNSSSALSGGHAPTSTPASISDHIATCIPITSPKSIASSDLPASDSPTPNTSASLLVAASLENPTTNCGLASNGSPDTSSVPTPGGNSSSKSFDKSNSNLALGGNSADSNISAPLLVTASIENHAPNVSPASNGSPGASSVSTSTTNSSSNDFDKSNSSVSVDGNIAVSNISAPLFVTASIENHALNCSTVTIRSLDTNSVPAASPNSSSNNFDKPNSGLTVDGNSATSNTSASLLVTATIENATSSGSPDTSSVLASSTNSSSSNFDKSNSSLTVHANAAGSTTSAPPLNAVNINSPTSNSSSAPDNSYTLDNNSALNNSPASKNSPVSNNIPSPNTSSALNNSPAPNKSLVADTISSPNGGSDTENIPILSLIPTINNSPIRPTSPAIVGCMPILSPCFVADTILTSTGNLSDASERSAPTLVPITTRSSDFPNGSFTSDSSCIPTASSDSTANSIVSSGVCVTTNSSSVVSEISAPVLVTDAIKSSAPNSSALNGGPVASFAASPNSIAKSLPISDTRLTTNDSSAATNNSALTGIPATTKSPIANSSPALSTSPAPPSVVNSTLTASSSSAPKVCGATSDNSIHTVIPDTINTPASPNSVAVDSSCNAAVSANSIADSMPTSSVCVATNCISAASNSSAPSPTPATIERAASPDSSSVPNSTCIPADSSAANTITTSSNSLTTNSSSVTSTSTTSASITDGANNSPVPDIIPAPKSNSSSPSSSPSPDNSAPDRQSDASPIPTSSHTPTTTSASVSGLRSASGRSASRNPKFTDKPATRKKHHRKVDGRSTMIKRRWTDEEMDVVMSFFAEHMRVKALPTNAECQELLDKHTEVAGRTPAQIRAWVNNFYNHKTGKWRRQELDMMKNYDIVKKRSTI